MAAAQSRRRRLDPVLVAVAVAAAVVGAIMGGYLDFVASWKFNAFDYFLVRAPALLVLIVLALWGWRGAGWARLLAVAGGALFLGSLVGAWVAPSANPPSWSRGTLRLELGDPVNAVVQGPTECDSGVNWVSISAAAYELGSDAGLGPIGGEWIHVSLAFRTEEPMTGDLPFSTERHLDISGSSANQVRHSWDYDGEDQTQSLNGNGTPQRGTATFRAISPSPDFVSADGGFGQVAPFALSGRIDWTCQPPRGVPTVREGTWFR